MPLKFIDSTMEREQPRLVICSPQGQEIPRLIICKSDGQRTECNGFYTEEAFKKWIDSLPAQ